MSRELEGEIAGIPDSNNFKAEFTHETGIIYTFVGQLAEPLPSWKVSKATLALTDDSQLEHRQLAFTARIGPKEIDFKFGNGITFKGDLDDSIEETIQTAGTGMWYNT
jgi:hypothetical protein